MELVENTWQHPAKTSLGVPSKDPVSPKSIHLVGLGPSHHDFMQMWLNPETPEVLYGRDEIWTVNRGVFCVPHDVVFVMDHLQGEANNFPVYGSRLWHHDKPVITSDNLEGWPDHVHKFPFDAIWTFFQSEYRHPPRCEWAINSIVFVLQYAAFIGVEEIFTWGLDYYHHKSGRVEDGHSNVAYWVRVLEERGIKINAPHTSTFLDTSNRAFFYGYQEDPRPASSSRRATFRRLVGLDEAQEAEGG
jgi:hypothetical protein